jgi:Transposase
MVHVGVDLHKRSSQLAVLMPDGEVTQQRLENDPTQLERFFAQVPRGARVAIEASGTWWWFVDLVERLGHHAILSNPKQTKAIAAARLKNDRVDAERLALLLRGDRVDPPRRTAGGTGARTPSGESRLGADRDQESVVGPAEPAQPAAHLEQTLADRAGATRTRGVAPGCNSEHGSGGLRCFGSSMSRSAAWITSSFSAGGTIPACSASGPFLESAPSRPSS